jgi:hypothetical protein
MKAYVAIPMVNGGCESFEKLATLARVVPTVIVSHQHPFLKPAAKRDSTMTTTNNSMQLPLCPACWPFSARRIYKVGSLAV